VTPGDRTPNETMSGMILVKRVSVLPMLLTLVFSLNAESTFSGPVAGYVFDGRQRSIRPVLGGLGAAYLGPALATQWVYASVAPNGKMALGIGRGTVDLISDLAKSDRFSTLGDAIRMPDRIVWSRDSTTAVLSAPTSSLLQRVTGLGGSPMVHSLIDLSQFAGNAVSGWSVSPDGHTIALTTGAAGTAAVYLIVDDSIPTASIANLGDPGPSVFSSDGSSLFVLDRAAKKIVRLQIPTGGVEGSFDASSLPTISDMQASADGALLYIASSNSLTALDLSTWQPVWSQPLDMTPTSLTAFSVAPPVFLLDYDRSDASPVWLLDGQAARLYFVPAANAGGDASR